MNQFQSFGEMLAALRRRMFLILLVTVLGCGLSLWVALNQTKIYEAGAVVQIEEGQVPDSLAGASAQNRNALMSLIAQRAAEQNPQLSGIEVRFTIAKFPGTEVRTAHAFYMIAPEWEPVRL